MMKFLNEQKLEKLKNRANKLVKRALDQHVKLAITGLSRAGKTAFITSLVHQLTEQGTSKNLPFFNVIQQNRFLGAKKVPQGSLHIPSFAYQSAVEAITIEGNWPDSTANISELRIAIRYRPEHPLLSQLSDTMTMHLDIIDYPGEWLMDLPMLSLDYFEWSQLMTDIFRHEPRASQARALLDRMHKVNYDETVDETMLADIAAEYTELLHSFKQQGMSLLQPGRFILPGELAGAPVLQFFPLMTKMGELDTNNRENIIEGSNLDALIARYDEYKNRVVKQFYKDYFRHFDRQIVLVDCLSALNAGESGFNELRRSLELILQNFSYGKRNILERLFSPNIDKLLFAATKADQVTPEQYRNLTSLVDHVVRQSQKDIAFEGVDMETMAIASIQTTEAGTVQHEGEQHSCIRGVRRCEEATDNSARAMTTIFPGDVPSKIPSREHWQSLTFEFPDFLPGTTNQQQIRHLRLDHVLEFLLGDKLQ